MGPLTELESSVLAQLDEDRLVADLVGMVRMPSLTGSAAESELQHRLGRTLAGLDLDVDLWRMDLETLRDEPGFPGAEAPRDEGYGLVATTPGNGTPAVVLSGHVDVVPTGDLSQWQGVEPFGASVEGRMLRGRGACDMKAGLAANLAVARAVQSSGVRLERPLALHCVVGEEDGGLGAFATLLRGHTGDAAVIPEPTGGRMVVATAGALTFRIEVSGRAAHGSTRLEGVSAFEAFQPVYAALLGLELDRNADRDPLFGSTVLPYALSIGKVHCGDWSSSVPDRLVAEGRYGVRLDEDPAAARAVFEEAVAEAATRDPWLADHPPVVSWSGGQFASGRTNVDDPLVGDLLAAVADTTGAAPPELAAGPYGSDLRLYTGLGGMPTVHFGPGDVRMAHAPREQVDLDETFAVARALTVLVLRRCGAHR